MLMINLIGIKYEYVSMFWLILMVFCSTIIHCLLSFIVQYVDYIVNVILYYYTIEENCLKNIYKLKHFTCNRAILSNFKRYTCHLCMLLGNIFKDEVYYYCYRFIIVLFIVKNIYHVKYCFIYRYKTELNKDNWSYLISKHI
jgi:hypothetical protein